MTIWCHWPSVAFGSYLEMLPISLPHLSCFAQRRPTRMPSPAGATSGDAATILSWNFSVLATGDVRGSGGVPGGPVPTEADVTLALGLELEADAAVRADLRRGLERRRAGLRVARCPLLRRRSHVVAVPDDERLREVARGRCGRRAAAGSSLRDESVVAPVARSTAPRQLGGGARHPSGSDRREDRNQENRAILLSIHAPGHTARASRNQPLGAPG